MKKLTTDIFIQRALLIHGDKYDYSKVNYINKRTKVCIICKKHGEFYQDPISHLKGSGCKKCAIEKNTEKNTFSTGQFIEKAKLVHGDKYDYSKVNYINNATKICIICKKHGEFYLYPCNHLKGAGCKICALEENIKNQTFSTELFIEKAKLVHGDKYDYSKVNYINAHTKVCIICPIHGEFYLYPYEHLRRTTGCAKCGRNQLSLYQFIEKAKLVHGDKYDYSKVNYINSTTKIIITCKKHGDFIQLPAEHLKNHGCPKCSMSKLELNIYNLLININIPFEYNKFYKWLKNLQLDFFIPSLNIAIECQGKQHIKPIDFSGNNEKRAIEEFNKRILNDNIKYKICNKLNIKLLYYSNIEYSNYITNINDIKEIIENNILKLK